MLNRPIISPSPTQGSHRREDSKLCESHLGEQYGATVSSGNYLTDELMNTVNSLKAAQDRLINIVQ